MPRPKSRTASRSSRRRSDEPIKASARRAVLYARVSSKDQEKEGFSIPAQTRLLRDYAEANGIEVVKEFVDVETAKRAGRRNFGEMLKYLKKRGPTCRIVLVEKTDRLYRNLKDWVMLDGMELEIHLAKEGVVLSDDSRSTDKFMHGIRVLMAKNYIDNLSEEVKKGMTQVAEIQKAKYIYYHCSTNCQKEKYVREERLVELFGQVVKELQLGPELLEVAKRVLLESRETIKEDAAARMAAQRQRYDRYGALIDKAYVDKLEGRIDEAFFQDKRREWEAERTAAMDLMQRLARADSGNLDLGVQILELSDQAFDLYYQREPHDQRLLLDLLCSNSELGGGQLKVELRKPFCFLRNLAQEARNETAPSGDSEGGRPIWWAILDSNQ